MKKNIYVGGFLKDGNKFLFGKRSKKKTWAPGMWDIAGGKSLKNEHPLYTLRRELMEEVGIEVINAELIATLDLQEGKKEASVYLLYMITGYKGTAVNCSNEHSKIKWFTRERLNTISLALPDYPAMIDEWMKAG